MPRAPETTQAINRVARMDGRTRVTQVYRHPTGWERVRGRQWFTPTTVQHLKSQDIRTVVLRRGFRRAQMPLSWVAEWHFRHSPGHA
ncbi:MAG: hypothetical protein QOE37_775 [Microbacteriaceae bacterium]|jgi:hypothetical protein|nr:hypothetical protein [Microbacteriaceae bacterium]